MAWKHGGEDCDSAQMKMESHIVVQVREEIGRDMEQNMTKVLEA